MLVVGTPLLCHLRDKPLVSARGLSSEDIWCSTVTSGPCKAIPVPPFQLMYQPDFNAASATGLANVAIFLMIY